MLTCLDLQPITAINIEAKLLKYFVWRRFQQIFLKLLWFKTAAHAICRNASHLLVSFFFPIVFYI